MPLLVAFALVAGCGSSRRARRPTMFRLARAAPSVHQIRAEHDRRSPAAGSPLVRLGRCEDRSGERARVPAMKGEATIMTRSQLTSVRTTAVRSLLRRGMRRADRYRTLGANRSRAAGQTLGIQIGMLNQHEPLVVLRTRNGAADFVVLLGRLPHRSRSPGLEGRVRRSPALQADPVAVAGSDPGAAWPAPSHRSY